jgi:hypothetical protein
MLKCIDKTQFIHTLTYPWSSLTNHFNVSLRIVEYFNEIEQLPHAFNNLSSDILCLKRWKMIMNYTNFNLHLTCITNPMISNLFKFKLNHFPCMVACFLCFFFMLTIGTQVNNPPHPQHPHDVHTQHVHS